MKKIKQNTFILILWAALMSLANFMQAQGTETFSYSFERTNTEGGWFFIERTTVTQPGGNVLINEVKTFRATEAEIDSFISAYKRGLDQQVTQAEAVFNDWKAKQDAAKGVGPAMMRTPSKTAIPDTTVKPEPGSVWTWDGSGYVPYVCPQTPAKKAPAKSNNRKKSKQ